MMLKPWNVETVGVMCCATLLQWYHFPPCQMCLRMITGCASYWYKTDVTLFDVLCNKRCVTKHKNCDNIFESVRSRSFRSIIKKNGGRAESVRHPQGIRLNRIFQKNGICICYSAVFNLCTQFQVDSFYRQMVCFCLQNHTNFVTSLFKCDFLWLLGVVRKITHGTCITWPECDF